MTKTSSIESRPSHATTETVTTIEDDGQDDAPKPIPSKVSSKKVSKVAKKEKLKGVSKLTGNSKKKSSDKSNASGAGGDDKADANEDLFDVNSDELLKIFEQQKQTTEKQPKIIKRASGYEILDQFRIGPDIVEDGVECTPLPHWVGKDTLPSYSMMLNRASDELIPMTPKKPQEFSQTTFDIRMYQQQSKSPAMSWNASLTTLEEEEFEAETQLMETHKVVHNLVMEDEVEKVYVQKVVNVTFPDGTTVAKRRLRVILSECDTVFLLQLSGKFEAETADEFEAIQQNNKRYDTMVQHHLESDAYSNRFAQTFENRTRDQYTEYKSPWAFDVGVQANYYLIEDEYEQVAEADAKRKLREEEEAQLRLFQERLNLERDAIDDSIKNDDEESDEDDKLSNFAAIDWSKYGTKYEEDEEEDDDMNYKDIDEKEFDCCGDEEQEFESAEPLEEIYQRQQRKQDEAALTVFPDITMGVVFLDRLISMEYMQDNQADMRGFPILNANRDADDKKDNKPHFFQLLEENHGKQATLDLGPNIKRYWSLKTPITKGREVTDIALHPKNGNIVAAAYGSTRFGDDEEGVVCVWSAKNTLYPERIYEFKAAVTCLAFATLTPYLLAIGMIDGNLVVYDVRSAQPLSMSSTIGSPDKHEGPIWQVAWFQETEMATTGSVSEILLSLGEDGRLNRWSSTKGFDSVTMLRVRRSPMKIPGRREKRAEALTSNLSAAFSVCFYPKDWTQYLVGTEEGFIHKCSISFTEQFVGTYIGHSGPVYRIVFNTFDKSIFVSASGDWSVKVWREGTYTPLLSMQTGLRTVFDVTCCPKMSSVFVLASEFHVEVWDLTLNTLEPVVQFSPPFAVAFRRAAYSRYLNSVILGDDEGAITFYGLRDFPPQPTNEQEQMDQLLEGLIPGYKKRQRESGGDASTHFDQYFSDAPGTGDAEPSHEPAETENAETAGDENKQEEMSNKSVSSAGKSDDEKAQRKSSFASD
ncbi:unnamed protein product [Allacma fusca]|uniref:WD repeat-containing protein 78 n=1 Tax=Allacma fusca TaxID=39272 RepID=A0A8J2PVC5_9HEXA|nr:unnamed protein product [Allacma fusca]